VALAALTALQITKWAEVASTGKRRTTRAKLNREAKLREKRIDKQARKAARRLPAEDGAAYGAFGSEELAAGALDDGRRDGAEEEAVAAATELEGRSI